MRNIYKWLILTPVLIIAVAFVIQQVRSTDEGPGAIISAGAAEAAGLNAVAEAEKKSGETAFDSAVMDTETQLLDIFLPKLTVCAFTYDANGLLATQRCTTEPDPNQIETAVDNLAPGGTTSDQILPVDRLLPNTGGVAGQFLIPVETSTLGAWGPNLSVATPEAGNVLKWDDSSNAIVWGTGGGTGDITHIHQGRGITVTGGDTGEATVALDGCLSGEVLASTGADYACEERASPLPAGTADGQVFTWDATASPEAPAWETPPPAILLQTADVTLTSAQLIGLDDAGVEIIAAPASDKYIRVHELWIAKTGATGVTASGEARIALGIFDIAAPSVPAHPGIVIGRDDDGANIVRIWYAGGVDGRILSPGARTWGNSIGGQSISSGLPLEVRLYFWVPSQAQSAPWDTSSASLTDVTLRFHVTYSIGDMPSGL